MDPEERKKEQEETKQKIEKELQEEAEQKKIQQSAKKEAESKIEQAPETEEKEDTVTPVKPPKSSTGQATTKKKPARQNQFKQVPRNVVFDEEQKDYSHLYRNFYDIFVGHQVDNKAFDLNYAVRDTRNVYASFVNLMENHFMLQQKHKFSKNPLERGYVSQLNNTNQAQLNHFTLMGQNLNELEAQFKGGLPNAAEEEQNQKQ